MSAARRSSPRWSRLAGLLAALALLAPARPADAAYHLLSRTTLGGDGGWDLLTMDPEAHRLYIARGDRVMVVDADSCTMVGKIANLKGVHGVAVAREFGRGFITAAGDSSVVFFDLKTLAIEGRVPTGPRPDAILYDPASKRVFAFNAGGQSATVIDAATGTLAGTVALGGQPELAAVDGAGKLYVNLEDKAAVQVVDTRRLRVLSTWPLAPGTGPTGLALDVEHHRLFAACAEDTLMVVMDAATGQVLITLPIGHGADGAGWDPGMNRAFSSNGAGTLTIVEEVTPDAFRVAGTIPTQAGARTLAVDPVAHRIYTVSAEFGPPPPATTDRPHPRRSIVPGSFVLLVYGP